MVTTRRRAAAAASVPAVLGALFGLGPLPPAPSDPPATHARRAASTGASPEVVDMTAADASDEDDDYDDSDNNYYYYPNSTQASPPRRHRPTGGGGDGGGNHRETSTTGGGGGSPNNTAPAAVVTTAAYSTRRTLYASSGGGSKAPLPSLALPHLALLCIAVSALALMLSLALHLGIVAGGFIGPAWSTFKAIERRPGAAPVTRWASFWVVAAVLFGMDRLLLAAVLKPWLPGPMYSLMLFVAVVWLSRDDAVNTERLYDNIARPLLLRYEDRVDSLIGGIADRVDDLSRFGLIQVSNVVKPIAVQLDHAAAVAREQHDRIAERRRHQNITY
jgi:hypothetical protein